MFHAEQIATYEAALRARAAEKYPNPTPEQAEKLERKIVNAVNKYAERQALKGQEQGIEPDYQPPTITQPPRHPEMGMGI